MTGTGTTVDLADAADTLYALVPPEFTAARDALAAEARRQGDRPTADAIKALKRPSAPAWAVNVLARERADDLQRLLGLGASLREAQARLSADDMRELARQRHGVITGLTRTVRDLAASRRQPVSEAAARQIEQTLNAALADEAAAAAVASGRLVRALEHSGIGDIDLDGAVGGPRPGPLQPASQPPPRPKPGAPTKAIEAARARVGAARTALEEARDALGAAEAAARQAGDRQSRADEEVRRIERDLAQAKRESESAQRQLDAAARTYTKAEEAAQAAEARAREAEDRLAGLEAGDR